MRCTTSVANPGDATIRSAIAATFVTVYFVFLGLFTFNPELRDRLSSDDRTADTIAADVEFGESLFSTFTTLVGTVVSFYLASTAAVEATKRYADGKFQSAQASVVEPTARMEQLEQEVSQLRQQITQGHVGQGPERASTVG